jgi:hypothetical protein
VKHRTLIRNLVIIAVTLLFALGGVTNINSGRELTVDALLIVLLVTVADVAATGRPFAYVVRLFERWRATRPLVPTVLRRNTPVVTRAVTAAAITIGLGAAILGASVGARPDTEAQLQRALAALPALPANTALVRLDPSPTATTSRPQYGARLREGMSPELRDALANAIPGANVIELRGVGSYYEAGSAHQTMTCPTCEPSIVEQNDRLKDLYSTKPKYGIGTYTFAPQKKLPDHVPAVSRFPDHRSLRRAVVRHHKLPPATFDGARFGEVPAPYLFMNDNIPMNVRAVFLRAPQALSPADLDRLQHIVTTASAPSNAQLALIGPQGSIVPPANARPTPTPVTDYRISRRLPWAASTGTSRAVVVVVAALVALLTVVLTAFARRDTPRAAAFLAGLLLAFLTWGNTLVVTVLVARGTHAFSNLNADMPIPLSMPWGAVALFVVVVPLAGAGLAALVSRRQPPEGAFDH